MRGTHTGVGGRTLGGPVEHATPFQSASRPRTSRKSIFSRPDGRLLTSSTRGDAPRVARSPHQGRVPHAEAASYPKPAQRRAIATLLLEAIENKRGLYGKEMSSVREAFEAFDRNGDGHISPDEFGEAVMRLDLGLTLEQVDAVVDTMDTNHDGEIEWREFVTALLGSEPSLEEPGEPSGEDLRKMSVDDIIRNTKPMAKHGTKPLMSPDDVKKKSHAFGRRNTVGNRDAWAQGEATGLHHGGGAGSGIRATKPEISLEEFQRKAGIKRNPDAPPLQPGPPPPSNVDEVPRHGAKVQSSAPPPAVKVKPMSKAERHAAVVSELLAHQSTLNIPTKEAREAAEEAAELESKRAETKESMESKGGEYHPQDPLQRLSEVAEPGGFGGKLASDVGPGADLEEGAASPKSSSGAPTGSPTSPRFSYKTSPAISRKDSGDYGSDDDDDRQMDGDEASLSGTDLDDYGMEEGHGQHGHRQGEAKSPAKGDAGGESKRRVKDPRLSARPLTAQEVEGGLGMNIKRWQLQRAAHSTPLANNKPLVDGTEPSKYGPTVVPPVNIASNSMSAAAAFGQEKERRWMAAQGREVGGERPRDGAPPSVSFSPSNRGSSSPSPYGRASPADKIRR